MRRTLLCCGGAVAAQCPLLQSRRQQASSRCSSDPSHWHIGWRWYDQAEGASPGKLNGPRWSGPASRPGEALFSTTEVAARNGTSPDRRLWVTYRDGVYDVTDYVREHPGGHFLMQAVGGPIDGFWRHWAQHQMSKQAAEALEKLRIGRLRDYKPEADEEQKGGGIWEAEQTARGRQESRKLSTAASEMPYQTETKVETLGRTYYTPNSAFYVRNHAPVPEVAEEDADGHHVTFSHGESEVVSLTLADLRKRFQPVHITSFLQCAGNRAGDNIAANGFEKSGFVGGDSEFIGLSMLGNAAWTGYRLSEILPTLLPQALTGSTEELHVTFEGLDGYYTSTPLKYVLDRSADCLLATEMNGEPLPPDHGFPVRALLPGIAGSRNVKWVTRISVGPECDSPWNRKYYLDKPDMVPIQELPLNSVLLSPEPGAWLDVRERKIAVRGVAYTGRQHRCVTSVEVSSDRGQTWQPAKCLNEAPRDDSSRPHGWVRFEAEAELPPPGTGPYHDAPGSGGPLTEIWCRAWDDAGSVQPPVGKAHGGYLYDGYHRVPIVRSSSGPPLATPAR